jgi:hypothetical protein
VTIRLSGQRRPLNLSPGYPPWYPCAGCVRLQVFGYERGVPVDGIFLYGEDQHFLFTRLGFDAFTGTDRYAFVPLSRRILLRLQNADGSYATLRERCLTRPGILYAAVTGTGDAQKIVGRAEPPRAERA